MKILVCTVSFPYFDGGISDARFVYSEVMSYAQNNAEVIVLTPGFPGAPVVEKIGGNITVYRFSYFWPGTMQVLRTPGQPIYDSNSLLAFIQLPLLCLGFAFHILRLCRDVDIIHAQWTPTALLSLPAKWIFGKILVVTSRGSDIRLLPAWLNRFILKNVTASIDCFGPIKWNLDNKKNFSSNYIRLPTLVYKDPVAPCPDEIDKNCFVILYVGRFHSIKVTENSLPLLDLVHAGKELQKRNINFRIYYVGDGDLALVEELTNSIKGCGLEDQIKILGSKTNVIDYMSACNVGVGGIAFNGVAQEYTICNTPQVFIDNDDNSDTPWRNKRNCLMAKPGDKKNLFEALLWAYENPKETSKLADHAAIDTSEYFASSEKGGKIYINTFQKLLNENQ